MGVFKLGKMTFGSLFKKPETVLYPLQTKPQPTGLKGHIEIDVGTCILCGMCERSCATNCIRVDKAERYWEIDRFQCVQCGYCITVCPKKCLSMNPDYAPASTERKPDRVEIPVQEKDGGKTVPEKAAKAEKAVPKTAEPASQEKPEEAIAPAPSDAALEAKLAIMDAEKAEKVRAALAARRSM